MINTMSLTPDSKESAHEISVTSRYKSIIIMLFALSILLVLDIVFVVYLSYDLNFATKVTKKSRINALLTFIVFVFVHASKKVLKALDMYNRFPIIIYNVCKKSQKKRVICVCVEGFYYLCKNLFESLLIIEYYETYIISFGCRNG